MKIEWACSICKRSGVALIQLPVDFDTLQGTYWEAHRVASPLCDEQNDWEGLTSTVSVGAEDRPSSVFNICRHADGCGCYVRCACEWLYRRGAVCRNPHCATESAKKGAA